MKEFDTDFVVSTRYLGREENHPELSKGLKDGEMLVTTKQFSDNNLKDPIEIMSHTKQEII